MKELRELFEIDCEKLKSTLNETQSLKVGIIMDLVNIVFTCIITCVCNYVDNVSTSLQVAPPFEHFANSRMSRVQRWFVASRIYEFAPIKYLLKRLMMKQILRESPYERHVGLVGAPAGEEVGTRIVFDVIDSETFKNIVRLVSYITRPALTDESVDFFISYIAET